MLKRESLGEIKELLVVNVGVECAPELEDCREIVLRMRGREEMSAESLSGENGIECRREARKECCEHRGNLMRREETLRVLSEREEIGRDVPVIANERSVATNSEGGSDELT